MTDRIEIAYTAEDDLASALEACREMICRGTLARKMTRMPAEEGWTVKEWDINGKQAVLGIIRTEA